MSQLNEGIEDIYAEDGRLLFLGMRSFTEKVLASRGCFVCGSTNSLTRPVNDEHIIPSWLIRHAGIASEGLVLANEQEVKYGQYKLAMCAKCNSDLAAAYEDRISPHIKEGYEAFKAFFEAGGYTLTYQWLCLLLIKLLLKDNQLRWEMDQRLGRTDAIGDRSEWHRHHHLLCVARSGHHQALIHPVSLGSIFLLKAKDVMPFDLGTVPHVNAIRLQVGDLILVGLLDDAQFVLSQFSDLERPFPHEVDRLQLIEFFARTFTLSEFLRPRPQLYTDLSSGRPVVRANRPRGEIEFLPVDQHAKLVGERTHQMLSRSGLLNLIPESNRAHIERGEWTFFPGVLG